jgi:hypothetical protein
MKRQFAMTVFSIIKQAIVIICEIVIPASGFFRVADIRLQFGRFSRPEMKTRGNLR